MTPALPASLDATLRFDTFVVGASNRLAASAARAVADAPGAAYNPLFIYGGSGRGKTHLVAAIAHAACEQQSETRVLVSSGEEVAEHLHRAIAAGTPGAFLAHYEQVDLLILDDVQFLTGQRETQSELLRLLNLLLQRGHQLVLTSDRQPHEIADVDERLLSRLSGGLVVDVGAPDYEMRLAILRNVATARAVEFAAGVLEDVARLPFANVRELKGALNKLTAYQQLEGKPVAAADVRAVLGEPRGEHRVDHRIGTVSTPTAAPRVTDRIEAIIPADADYEGFIADVMHEVEAKVEPWRVQLGEALGRWRQHGYNVAALERAMALPTAPDVPGLLDMFGKAIEHLRTLEVQAVTADPSLRGHPVFRDPSQIEEARAVVQRALATATPLPAPLPTLTRDALEVAPANQLALKAVDAVIEEPGARYNPLYLHGPLGSGKSHMAHAIGNAVRTRWPEKLVACLSGQAFVEEYVAALQEGAVERWRLRYRAADVFILDDLQQLIGKERTQEELFHLFNHLLSRGAQVVLAGDRSPRDLLGLADRLRSRFEGGLVVGVQPRERPRLETLVARAPGEVDRFFEDREKSIWQWPDVSGRLIEEYR
ncbi:MAG: ATP-binding protein [Gemmatimonadaceae bacterium]|nr:ATP-binding protein [Gemmatimonadaceae bacterium]